MSALHLAAAVAALASLAPPAQPKQSFDATFKPDGYAAFLPSRAVIEVDGKVAGRGSVTVEVTDPKRIFRVRASADGFEPEEATVEAARIGDREFMIVLSPAGWTKRIDARDPSATALAADALWRAGRTDDAAEYADYSLRLANTPLANRVMGDVWRKRGDREKATQYYAMYMSISNNAAEKEEIRAWLLQDRPGDITIPAQ